MALGYHSTWQLPFGDLPHKLKKAMEDRDSEPSFAGSNSHDKERRRRELWNYKHDFGNEASAEEKECETAMRRLFAERRDDLTRNPGGGTKRRRC